MFLYALLLVPYRIYTRFLCILIAIHGTLGLCFLQTLQTTSLYPPSSFLILASRDHCYVFQEMSSICFCIRKRLIHGVFCSLLLPLNIVFYPNDRTLFFILMSNIPLHMYIRISLSIDPFIGSFVNSMYIGHDWQCYSKHRSSDIFLIYGFNFFSIYTHYWIIWEFFLPSSLNVFS